MPHSTESEIKVTPVTPDPSSKINFGAVVTGVDLNNLDDASFKVIEDAIYVHKVIVIKGQHDLIPFKQFDFIRRTDPDTAPVHGFGAPDQYKDSDFINTYTRFTVPNSGGVRLVGKGYHGKDHYGMKDVTVPPLTHYNLHGNLLTKDEIAAGQTRFFGWHFDGILYDSYPSRITALRCIQAPKGPDLTIRWDDGTGSTMKVTPGRTAFVSGVQLYDLLSPEDQKLADHSRWECAPHPFVWRGTRKQRSTGMGLEPGGEVLPLDKLPEWTPDKVQCYPMVFVDQRTGEKSLQIMPTCVRKLHLRSSFDEEERVEEDLEKIRVLLNGWMDKIIQPEYIFFPPSEEGDVAMWNNYATIHSAVDYPDTYGPRIVHQIHMSSSTPPVGVKA